MYGFLIISVELFLQKQLLNLVYFFVILVLSRQPSDDQFVKIVPMSLFSRLLLLFIISVIPVFGQQDPLYKWYTSDNGQLPQNSVKSIVPDELGFIWLATEDGLVRFDGQQFKVYNSENIKGLKSNRMKFVKKNYKGKGHYVANDLGQILKIETDPKLYYKDGKDIHSLNEIGRLFGNNIKISTSFFKYYRRYEVLIKDKVFQFYPDSIRYYSVSTKKRISGYPHKLAFDSELFILNNTLYLKSKKQYSVVTPQKLIPIEMDQPTKEDGSIYINNAIDQAFLYADGNLYYLTADQNGLHKKRILSHFDVEKQKVHAFYYDTKLNILYLGSLTKGFLIIRPESFKSYVDEQDPVTYSNVLFDSTRVLTGKGQLIDYRGTITHLPSSLKGEKFYSVIDNNGDIWTLDIRNLYRYKKSANYTTYDRWTLQYFMSAVYKDEKGRIWIGTTDSKTYKKGQLYTIDPNVAAPKLTPVANLDFSPNNIYKDGNSRMLIGSPSGLYHMDLNTKYITRNSVIDESYVRGIHCSDGNNIWVYTYNNGLFLIRNHQGTTHFPFDKNKYLRSAHCVVEDQKGFIWIPTNKGLFQVSRQSLFDYADKKQNTIYYHYYDKSSGFSTNEFNGGCYPCATNLPNGYIALPSFEGLTFFDSKKVTPILPTNPIYSNEAKVDDRSVTFNDTLVINRDFSRVVISFNSPFYGNPENLTIEVRLDGNDVHQDWTKTSDNYTISYTTLYPGEYTLTARKVRGFDSQYDYKTVTIIVPPAFWQTIWFKSLLILTIALLIYYGFRQRTKYIRHQNLLLEKRISHRTAELKSTITALTQTQTDLSEQIHSHKKLIGSITHDIKSPLKYMALTGKYLYENLDRDNPDFQENIKTMYTSSFELYHFVNNLLEYSKIYLNKDNLQNEAFALRDLINEKIKLFDPIAKSKRNELENTVSDTIYLNLNKQLFTIILHNLLDNAIKNTINGTIRFSAVQDKHSTRISLMDTGCGMHSEMLHYYQTLAQKMKSESDRKQFTKGIGFHIIIELLHLVHGDITLESEVGKGTTITLILK